MSDWLELLEDGWGFAPGGDGDDGGGGDDSGGPDGDSGGFDPSAGDDNFGGGPSSTDFGGFGDDGLGDMDDFGTVSAADIAAAIGAINDDPGGSTYSYGWSPFDKDTGTPLGRGLGPAAMDAFKATTFGRVAIGIPEGLVSLNQAAKGFFDEMGWDVEHSYPGDEGYGGMTAAEQASMGGGADDALDQVAREMGWDNVSSRSGGGGSLSYQPGELPTRTRTRTPYHAPTPYEKVEFMPAPAWQEQQRAPQYRSYRGT